MSAPVMGEPRQKVCRRCKEEWPADDEFFYRDSNEPDGLRAICKACYHETPCIVKRDAARRRRNSGLL